MHNELQYYNTLTRKVFVGSKNIFFPDEDICGQSVVLLLLCEMLNITADI